MKYNLIYFALAVFIFCSIDDIAQQNTSQSRREKKPSEKLLPLTSCVILIIIDGFRNEDLRNPSINLSTLQTLRERGASVLNVESVYPAQSLPAHATILTGLLPADHGIVAERNFDEKTGRSSIEKDETASNIKTETIWQAAKRVGLKTAAINFPLTNGAELDFNSQNTNAGAEWFAKNHPQLMLIRFEELSIAIRQSGLGSVAASSALQEIDSSLKKILATVEQSGWTNETTWIVVSSHGFAKVEQEFRPNVILAKKGLLTLDSKGTVTNWVAAVRSSGGAAAVYLKDVKNEEMAKEVENLFAEVQKQDASPIWRLVSKKDATKLGADPRAAFFIEAAPGFVISEQATGKRVTEKLNPAAGQAVAGYVPSRSEMRGALIAMGKGIKPKTLIEYARLTDIAPTIARLLGFELKASRGHAISEILIQQKQ